jgi:transposase
VQHDAPLVVVLVTEPAGDGAETIAWLNAQPATWRAEITHATNDLSASYAKAAREALPDAVLVADLYLYHLVPLPNDMLTQVRQRVIRETRADAAARPTPPGRPGAGC